MCRNPLIPCDRAVPHTYTAYYTLQDCMRLPCTVPPRIACDRTVQKNTQLHAIGQCRTVLQRIAGNRLVSVSYRYCALWSGIHTYSTRCSTARNVLYRIVCDHTVVCTAQCPLLHGIACNSVVCPWLVCLKTQCRTILGTLHGAESHALVGHVSGHCQP